MSNISKRDYLNAKLSNFKKFINDHIPNDNSKFKNDLLMLCSVSVEDFTSYIIIKVKPFKNNVDEYINKMASEYNVDIIKYQKEDVSKLKRYLEMFIDIIEDV